MNIKDITDKLKPLRTKLHRERFLQHLINIFLLASGLALVLVVTSFFFVVTGLLGKLFFVYLIAMLLAAILFPFTKPGTKNTIIIADSLGLKERLITAYEYQNSNSGIAKLQREDAKNNFDGEGLKKLYTIKYPVKKSIILLVAITTIFVMYNIPTEAKSKSIDLENLRKEYKKEVDEVKELEKELNKLKDKETKEIATKEFNKLLKELEAAKTQEEMLKALAITKNELKKLKTKDGLEKTLLENEMTKGAGNALKSMDKEALNNEMEKLKKDLKDFDKKKIEELKEVIKKALEEMAKNEEVAKKDIQTLKNNINSSESLTQESIEQFQGLMNDYMNSESAADSSSISGLIASLDSSMDDINNLSSCDENGNQDTDKQNKDLQSASEGNGEDKNSQKGNGVCKGNGNSNTSGSGTGSGKGGGIGNGAGVGTTNKDMGTGSSGTTGSGKQPSADKIGEYEVIYDPERLGDGGNISQVKGKKGEKGTQSFEDSEKGPIGIGNMVPYKEVIGQYQQEALSGIDNASIPPGMQEMIIEYFSSLN